MFHKSRYQYSHLSRQRHSSSEEALQHAFGYRTLCGRGILCWLSGGRPGNRVRPQWPQSGHDRAYRLLQRERHSAEPAIIGRRWRASTASGQRCRWGAADCMGQRRRWERHRASSVIVMARETHLFFLQKNRCVSRAIVKREVEKKRDHRQWCLYRQTNQSR